MLHSNLCSVASFMTIDALTMYTMIDTVVSIRIRLVAHDCALYNGAYQFNSPHRTYS